VQVLYRVNSGEIYVVKRIAGWGTCGETRHSGTSTAEAGLRVGSNRRRVDVKIIVMYV